MSQAGVAINLSIGQRVRHRGERGSLGVTGVVRGISVSTDRVLEVDILLEEPIVIPARAEGEREIRIWHQHVLAHELEPVDDRDKLIVELRLALQGMVDHHEDVSNGAGQRLLEAARVALERSVRP